MPDNSIAANRSTLKDFLGSVATIKGDLSNITAPPFVLGDYSTVELPQYFADRPALFVAPAQEPSPEKRTLLILKNFLGSLRNQQYAGRNEEDGVKKPLNAFLGELFLGSWNDEEAGETTLVCEQVSHHPPVTACYIHNEKHGVTAEGFTQQAITFNGNVHVKQSGYAITRISRFNESYLIPLPSVKVKGVLTGTPYPELEGTYSIIASTGLVSEVKFAGKGALFGGTKHSFEARVYRADDPRETLYTASGNWNSTFSFYDARAKCEIEVFDTAAYDTTPITVRQIDDQDPWESRRAWSGVLAALSRGDMKGTVAAKAELEEGQRKLRQDEAAQGKEWGPLFFRNQAHDELVEKLKGPDRESFAVDAQTGVWKLDRAALDRITRPFHGGLLPTGQRAEEERTKGDVSQRTVGETPKPQRDAETRNGVSSDVKPTAASAPQIAPHTPNTNKPEPTPIEISAASYNAQAPSGATPQNTHRNSTKSSEVKLTNAQVEGMLRDKYTSSTR